LYRIGAIKTLYFHFGTFVKIPAPTRPPNHNKKFIAIDRMGSVRQLLRPVFSCFHGQKKFLKNILDGENIFGIE
jgi:hypothetical protein